MNDSSQSAGPSPEAHGVEADDTVGPRRQAREEGRKKNRKWAWWITGAAIVAVVAVIAGYLLNLANVYSSQATTIDVRADGQLTKDPNDGALNILLLGSDTRGEGQDTAENKGEDGARSDTIMLVHVSADRQNMYVMSVVRDLWVEIPGQGERKVNAAYSLGGYPLVVSTMESLFGVPIDHVVSIDFEGFKGLTNALGGVTVNNPIAFCSGQESPSCYEKGTIQLQDTAALRYVRERKAFEDGDFQRVQNQQRFLRAVARKLLNQSTLNNPFTVATIVNEVSPYLSVDSSLDAQTAGALLLQLKDIKLDNVKMFTLPTGEAGTGPGGASIITQDESAMAAISEALQNDDVQSFLDDPNHGTNAYGGSITDDSVETSPASSSASESANTSSASSSSASE